MFEDSQGCRSLGAIRGCRKPSVAEKLNEVGFFTFAVTKVDGDLVNSVDIYQDEVVVRSTRWIWTHSVNGMTQLYPKPHGLQSDPFKEASGPVLERKVVSICTV